MTGRSALTRAVWNRPYPLLVFTTFCWGGNAVASRLAVGEISPMAITCLRWVIVVAVLALVNGRSALREWPALRPRAGYVFCLGALGYTAFNALFYAAGHLTTAVNIGLLQGAMPALVLAGSVLAYGTRVRPAQVAGLALAGIGVLIAVSHGSLAVLRTLDLNVGDLWILISVFLYAGYTVALRRKPPVTPLTLFTAIAVCALLTSVPLLLWEIADGSVIWPTTLKGIAVMLFIALVPSLVSQITFMRGVELVGPGRAGLFVNLVPIFAAGLAVLVLDESFGFDKALALAAVLAGIALAERRPPAS